VPVEPGKNTVRITAQDGRQNTKTQSYELTVPAVAPRVFTYDANGNTLSDGLRSYEWDAENRLARVRHGDGSVTAFGYDGRGRRVWIEEKDAQGTVTSVRRYVWAGGTQPAEERDGSNTVLRRFYAEGEHAPGAAAPLARLFYAKDHLGSVREVTDAAGVLRARYDYGFWGNRTRVSGDAETAVGYTGHHHHGKSGLVLTWYRAYDPDTGRWLSRDPIAESGGINLYGYVGNDPVNGVDPWGLHDVVAHYYITSGQLTLQSPSVGYSVVAQMESGAASYKNGKYDPSIPDYRNNPDFQHVKSPDGSSGPAGPIPEGLYRITVRDGLKYGYSAYRLTPLSGNAIKYNRGGPEGPFVIHAKTGIGCIVPGGSGSEQQNQYNKIVDFMNQVTPKDRVYGYLNVHR
jgi:RHS repeat-associated protein